MITQEERLMLLDRLLAGDPVVWGRLVIEEHKALLECQSESDEHD